MEKKLVVYGINPVKILCQFKKTLIKDLFIDENFFKKNKNFINQYILKNKIQHTLCNKQFLNNITNNKAHQGIAAKISKFYFPDFYKYLSIYEKKDKSIILILDRITDINNFGNIIRTGLFFNIDAIIIPENHSANITSSIFKASSGAVFLQKIYCVTNLNRLIANLKKIGFWIYSTHINSGTNITDLKINEKNVIILGSEENGIKKSILNNSDYVFQIPGNESINSLNVSNAAGICLFYFKQKIDFSGGGK